MNEYKVDQLVNWGITKYEERVNQKIQELYEELYATQDDIENLAKELFSSIMTIIKEEFEPMILSIANTKMKLYSYSQEYIDRINVKVSYDISHKDFMPENEYSSRIEYTSKDYCTVAYRVRSDNELCNMVISGDLTIKPMLKVLYTEEVKLKRQDISQLISDKKEVLLEIHRLEEMISPTNLKKMDRKLRADSYYNSLTATEQELLEKRFNDLMENKPKLLK